ALVALTKHVRDVDHAHTVIMVQIENEAGILGSDRCYCPMCNEQFASGQYEARFGVNAAEAFSVVSPADYIDRLAAEANAISPIGRAERNVFYALGQFGALGFDPWAIDSPFPEMYAMPLVDPVGGEWGPQAYWLRDSYIAIGRAMQPIVEAQGTANLFTFVQE